MTPQFENYVRILLGICKQENGNFSQLAHDFDFRQEPITCSRPTSFQLTRGKGNPRYRGHLNLKKNEIKANLLA